jgi:hypothetical protein
LAIVSGLPDFQIGEVNEWGSNGGGPRQRFGGAAVGLCRIRRHQRALITHLAASLNLQADPFYSHQAYAVFLTGAAIAKIQGDLQ